MDVSAAHELVTRSAWSRFSKTNKAATQAQSGAVSGSLNDIAKFIVLSEQAWDAQRALVGLKWVKS